MWTRIRNNKSSLPGLSTVQLGTSCNVKSKKSMNLILSWQHSAMVITSTYTAGEHGYYGKNWMVAVWPHPPHLQGVWLAWIETLPLLSYIRVSLIAGLEYGMEWWMYTVTANCSLVPRSFPHVWEKGSGVLSDFSCHSSLIWELWSDYRTRFSSVLNWLRNVIKSI